MAAWDYPRRAILFREGIKRPEDVDHQLVRQIERKERAVPMEELSAFARIDRDRLCLVDLDRVAGGRIPITFKAGFDC